MFKQGEGKMAKRGMTMVVAGALLALGVAGTAIVSAQSAVTANRSETVNGWRVEDVGTDSADDPTGRLIRMTREIGPHRIEYEIEISGGGSRWGNARFGAGTNHDGRSCWKSGSAAAETGPPAARAGRVRTVLARELGQVERQCGSAPGETAALLEGFEGAFALLSSWHAGRLAEADAAAAADSAAMGNAAYDDMGMDMNMDMGMDASADMNAAMDPETEAMEDSLEAAADAAAAAASAADAAMNAADDPQ